MVPGPDGTMQIVYIDPQTGQQVDGSGFIDGYTQSLNQLGLNPLKDETEKPKSTAQTVIKKDIDQHGDKIPDFSQGERRGVLDNFGYINKPNWAGYTSLLPGPIGMAAKMGNTMVNASNVAATNKARGMMGLDDLDTIDSVKGMMKDRQGQVADVKIGDENYSVGFEAMTPDNRTNLTPMEATTRANLAGGLKEEPNPAAKDTGIFSSIFDHATSFFDSLFGDEKKDTGSEYTGLDRFPDKPASAYAGYTPESYDSPIETSGIGRGSGFGHGNRSYDGKSYSGQNKGLDSPSEGGGRFGGSGLGSPDKSKDKSSKSDKEKDRSV